MALLGDLGNVLPDLVGARKALGGAALAGNHVREAIAHRACRAGGAVDDRDHAFAHGIPVCRIAKIRLAPPLDRIVANTLLRGVQEVRSPRHAAGGEHGDPVRQLHRRDHPESLADAGDDRLARIPGQVEAPALPVARRQDATGFPDQIDAGRLTEAEFRHLFGELVDAHVQGQPVVVGVHRLRQRLH